MESERVVFDGSSSLTSLLQNERLACSSDAFDSLWISSSSPSFYDTDPTVDIAGSSTFFASLDAEENNAQEEDDCGGFDRPEKRRRLTVDQVKFLEKSFEVENKLEPERKVRLAKELNLQPRQVAIWFQNRRARFKTKQLEKEYGLLKASFEKLKAGCEALQEENQQLKDEIQLLTGKLIPGDKGVEESKPFGILDLRGEERQETNRETPYLADRPMTFVKQEDANSSGSDVLDSDSPSFTQVEHPLRFPKVEDESLYIDPRVNYSLSVDYNDQTLWSWS